MSETTTRTLAKLRVGDVLRLNDGDYPVKSIGQHVQNPGYTPIYLVDAEDPTNYYEMFDGETVDVVLTASLPQDRKFPPAHATNLMAGPMEQRISALEAAIAALTERVATLEAESDEPSQGYATLAEAIAAENEKFIAEQAALGYDAELVASTVLSDPEFICPVSCARCDKTVEYGELDERGLCHLCVMDLTEDDASPEPLYPKPDAAPAAKAVAPKLTAWQRHLLLLLLTTKSLIVSGAAIHYEQQNGLNLYEDIPQQELQDLCNADYVARSGGTLLITDLGRAILESAS